MYESHVTVEGLTDETFLGICTELGVKPVIIESDTGSNVRQMMTAKFHKTNNLLEAKHSMYQIGARFGKGVIRHKLEEIIGRRSELPDHEYLEFHLKYEIHLDEIEEFVDMVLWSGGHTAKNTLKQTSNPKTVYHFATARDLDAYNRLLVNLRDYRRLNGIMECVVFDDNPQIDSNWYGCDGCAFKTVPDILEAAR